MLALDLAVAGDIDRGAGMQQQVVGHVLVDLVGKRRPRERGDDVLGLLTAAVGLQYSLRQGGGLQYSRLWHLQYFSNPTWLT